MDRNTRIIIIVAVILLLLVACCCLVVALAAPSWFTTQGRRISPGPEVAITVEVRPFVTSTPIPTRATATPVSVLPQATATRQITGTPVTTAPQVVTQAVTPAATRTGTTVAIATRTPTAASRITPLAEVEIVENDIATYEVPTGWSEEYQLSFLGFSIVSYAPATGDGHITLLQAPRQLGLSQAELEEQLRRATRGRAGEEDIDLRPVGEQQATIRGDQVTLRILEGTNSRGQRYRSMVGAFEGENGPALLSISMPVSQWNEQVINSFVDSIR